tara:strand:- start:4569 stop:4889 length:321 start_codon:yes stop_codon:yes gene_type:complete
MKSNKLLAILLVTSISYSVGSLAHDPKEHAKEKQPLDCSSMQDMQNMKDKNDPVTMAMMKKCQKTSAHEMPMDMKSKHKMEDMHEMEGMEDMEKQQDKHGDHNEEH